MTRILLVRTSALGDIVHCLPALRALRRHLPDARIGWVVEDVFAPLLQHDPDLDLVLAVGLRRWRKTPFTAVTGREVSASLRALSEFGADVVLDLMGNHKAGLLAAVAQCDRRIGLARPLRRERSSAAWLTEWVSPLHGSHAVDRALAVAAALGASERFEGFGRAQILAASRGLPPPCHDYVVIHPGAAWATKRYPADRWGRVAAALAAGGARTVLVSAGPGERGLQAEVVRSSGGAAMPAEAPDLPRLVALLAGAALVLGGDTGPLHLAHALEVPTLFLHGPTDPATHGPYGAPERALRDAAAPPAASPRTGRGATGAAGIDLPEALVIERALDLVRQPRASQAPAVAAPV